MKKELPPTELAINNITDIMENLRGISQALSALKNNLVAVDLDSYTKIEELEGRIRSLENTRDPSLEDY